MRAPLRGLLRLLPLLALAGCPAPNGGERSWLAMGTTATVKWNDNRDFPQWDAPNAVRESFGFVEKLLNAHDPESELSRLAPLTDAEILKTCTGDVRPCYAAAFLLRDRTGGAFNPRWKGPGTMDLGAIAKGFAVDWAIDGWVGCDVKSYWRILVDLGGSLKAAGTKGWKAGVKGGGTFTLAPGEACATSGEYFRGKHIYDGRTGRPVTNDVVSVTVLCKSAMWADGLSTTLFVFGPDEGRKFMDRFWPELDKEYGPASVLWILKDGSRVSYGPARFE